MNMPSVGLMLETGSQYYLVSIIEIDIPDKTAFAAKLAWIHLLYYNLIPVQIAVVESADSLICFFVVGHFYKAKAFGSCGILIPDYIRRIYHAISFKDSLNIIGERHRVQLCYKNIHLKRIKSEKIKRYI